MSVTNDEIAKFFAGLAGTLRRIEDRQLSHEIVLGRMVEALARLEGKT